MATDDERREVARRLRGLEAAAIPDARIADHAITAEVIAAGVMYDLPEVKGLFDRLADLIDPDCDRDTPQKVAEEMFGKMRHSTKEEADAYEAMLKSMSVELHPVDRDALLALADKMSRYASLRSSIGMDVDAMAVGAWVRRIREALGVEHG